MNRAAMIGLGAVPWLSSMREQIVRKLRGFPIRQLDMLQCYALAAMHAHMVAGNQPATAGQVQTLVAQATPLREDLMRGADMAVHFGIFDEGRLAMVRRGTGHLDIGTDLIALGALFKEKWAEVERQTPVKLAQVERANELGIELVTALGVRMHPNGQPMTVAEAADRRVRAFTLYVNAYDTCRRALTFLRWADKDVDRYMPTLFSRPAKRRVYESEEPAEDTTNATPADTAGATSGTPAATATTPTVAAAATSANGPSPPAPEVPKAA